MSSTRKESGVDILREAFGAKKGEPMEEAARRIVREYVSSPVRLPIDRNPLVEAAMLVCRPGPGWSMTEALRALKRRERHLKATVFKCACCESATFKHPAEDLNCKSVHGQCELLRRAGWRPAWVRIVLLAPKEYQDQHILSRGAWVCPECIGRLAQPEERLEHSGPVFLGNDPKTCSHVYPVTRAGQCHGCGVVIQAEEKP
jgi:hypothetical protein